MPNEERVREILEDFYGAERVRLQRQLGWPPRLERQIGFDWRAHEAELASTLYRALRPVWEQAAGQFACAEALDLSSLSRRLDVMAQQQARDMAARLTGTTIVQVGSAIAKASAGELRRNGWYSALRDIFGGARLDVVAASVTTQAGVSGVKLAAEACEAQTLRAYRRVWRTAHDERVCPVCGPLDGTTREVWGRYYNGGLMAHPQCRCWIEYRKPARRRTA